MNKRSNMTRKLRAITLAALMVLSVVSFAAPAAAAGNTTVSLQPGSQSVSATQTATYNVTVDTVDNGVSAYSFNVSINDTSVGEITDVSLVGPTQIDGTLNNITYADDNSSVMAYTTLDGDVLSDGTIATVTVSGVNPGNASLSLEVNQLADAGDPTNDYTVTGTNGADLQVTESATNFQISNLTAPTSALKGDTITVTADVTNEGTAAGTQDVSYLFDGTVEGTIENVSLDPGQSTPVEFTFDVPTGIASGDYTHGIETADDSVTATISLTDQTGFISGRVSDQFNDDVANATVTVTQGGAFITNTTTNQDGEYTVELAPGTYNVEVLKEGFDTAEAKDLTVESDRTTTANLVIRQRDIPTEIEVSPTADSALVGEMNNFTVTVYDQDGDVLPDTTVEATTTNADIQFVTSQTLTTDDNGEATFTVTSDSIVSSADITFTAAGGENPSVTAQKSFYLTGDGTIVGQVFHNDSSYGLEDATVYAVQTKSFHQQTQSYNIDISGSSDDLAYFRVLDRDSGNVVPNSEYRVQISNSTTDQISLITQLNTTDPAVGSGFVAVDRDGDASVSFDLTMLAPGNYTVQMSPAQADNSKDQRFESTTTEPFTDVDDFETTIDLRSSAIEEQFSSVSTDAVDETDEDGDYLLRDLYTDGQAGVDYTVIAQKAGYNTDFAEAEVREDGVYWEGQGDSLFVLEERDIRPVFNVDVEVADDEGNFVESARTAIGTERQVELTIEVKQQGQPDSEFEPLADSDLVDSADLTVALTNGSDVGTLESDGTTGDSINVTASNSTVELSPGFLASETVTGNATIDVTAVDEGGLESDPASVEVFGTTRIEGDLVNSETQEGIQDILVRLYRVDNGNLTQVDITQAGGDGSFGFANVETGETYRVTANENLAFPDYDSDFTTITITQPGTRTVGLVLSPEEDNNNNTDGNETFLEALDGQGNDNGLIGFQEVLDAIGAYNNGGQIGDYEVTFQRVLEAIQAYNNETNL
jgi:surface glycoprotein (TIGR04207 family)